ncbi:ABC transporter [Cryptosporangium minutisporangium]|uniref:ABC transporter n=1 Tax=Cryptosporangium minutisporangium TaxID=113569 RepID=A0ABP6T785_9ACTN
MLRFALAAAWPTVRAARTGPFLLAAAAGLLLLAVPAALNTALDPESLTLQLRLAAVCAGIGAVFLLDDPSKPTTLVVPGPAWVTTALRVGLALGVAAVWWVVALTIVLTGAEEGVGDLLLLPGTTLEAATIIVLALALAVAGYRLAERGVASAITAPALLVVVGAAALLPRGVALFVGVTDPAWAAAHDRWGVVLAGAGAALLIGAIVRR